MTFDHILINNYLVINCYKGVMLRKHAYRHVINN